MKDFKDKLMYPFIAGALLMALGASAKAIVDVSVLNAKITTFKELLFEVRSDVKDIKNTLLKK